MIKVIKFGYYFKKKLQNYLYSYIVKIRYWEYDANMMVYQYCACLYQSTFMLVNCMDI